MGVLDWKLLPFFKLLPGPVLTKVIHEEVCDYCFNEAFRVFCDVRGGIYIYSSNWECNFVQMFGRHKRLCALTETNLLITLEQKANSDDRQTSDITIMVYNLNRITNRELIPIGSAQLKLTSATECTLLKTVMLNNLLYIFIALEDGNVIYHEGHLVADMTANFRRITVCNSRIMDIEFFIRSVDNVKVFICSENGIYCCNLHSLPNDTSKMLLDKFSATVHCCTTQLFWHVEQYFAVAHNDAIYCYTIDGRGPCYAIKGRKLMLAWYGKHLIVVLESNTQTEDCTQNENSLFQLVVIDIEYKIIVFNQDINSIQAILPDYSLCKFYIYLNRNREIVMMREYDVEAKLRLLLKNNLYDIALRLVEGLDNTSIASMVYSKYGDYLMKRGDTAAAVEMYIRTVGKLPPYQIIKQLMALRYNDYLLQYLKAMEKTAYATSEHKELLQLCYERSKLTENTARIFQKEKNQSNLEIDATSATSNSPLQPFVDILYHRYGKSNHITDDQYHLKDFLEKMPEKKIIEFLRKNGSFILRHHPNAFVELMPMLSLEMLMILTPLLLKNDECCLEFFQQLEIHHKDYLPYICTIWLNILLRLWRNSSLPTTDAITFLEKHNHILQTEEVMMICRRYEFLHGIKHIYRSKNFGNLSCNYIHTFDKCDLSDPSQKRHLMNDEIIKSCHMLYLYTLSRNLISLEDTLPFAKDVLQTILNLNPQMLLKTLECLASSKQFLSSHVNYLFADNLIQQHFDNSALKQTVAGMESRLSQDKELLSNYFQKPIEFRSTSCDLCKMPLKLPIIYYLCQHSFHKECIQSYMVNNQNCVICERMVNNKVSQPANTTDRENNRNDSKTHIVQMIADMLTTKGFP